MGQNMFFRIRLIVFGLFVVFAVQPAWAESVYTCPDISNSVKVGECPSEDDLLRMFSSTCGSTDTQKENPHAKGFCKNYSMFRKVKNTSLWESGDGEYMGYLSCDSTENKIKASKLVKISIGQKRVIDRVICTYEGGFELALRTRETCEIPNAKLLGRYMSRICEAGDKDCKAICQ